MSKGTRHKTRRRASAESDVVITTLPSGEREFVVDPKAAAELSPAIEAEVVEFKAVPVVESPSAPVWTCDSCGRQAGRDEKTGEIVILFQRSTGKNECLDCVNVKAQAIPDVKSELIAAFDAYREVSVEIIAKLLAERGQSSSVSTKSQSMRQLIHGPHGKRKRVALNDDRRTSPSQAAAAHAIGKHGLHTTSSKPKAAPVEAAIFVYDEKGNAIPKCEQCGGTGKVQAGHVTCPDCRGSGYMKPKSVEETIDAKIAAGLMPITAPEYFIEMYAGSKFVDASVSTVEQAAEILQRDFDAKHPVFKSGRKFRSS